MITPKALAANAALLIGASFPQLVSAEEFTAADVLEWSEEQQSNYFQISVRMVGIVAAQMERNAHIADCIDGWYSAGGDSEQAYYAKIREVMRSLSDYHPQALILAVIHKECDKFQ